MPPRVRTRPLAGGGVIDQNGGAGYEARHSTDALSASGKSSSNEKGRALRGPSASLELFRYEQGFVVAVGTTVVVAAGVDVSVAVAVAVAVPVFVAVAVAQAVTL